MTGPLVLPGDPVTPTQAADKHYVDTNITAVLRGRGTEGQHAALCDADGLATCGYATAGECTER